MGEVVNHSNGTVFECSSDVALGMNVAHFFNLKCSFFGYSLTRASSKDEEVFMVIHQLSNILAYLVAVNNDLLSELWHLVKILYELYSFLNFEFLLHFFRLLIEFRVFLEIEALTMLGEPDSKHCQAHHLSREGFCGGHRYLSASVEINTTSKVSGDTALDFVNN